MASVIDEAIKLLGERGLAKQEGRIAFQKLALLIQSLEDSHEYRFLWGLYGPYSASLAEEMHERLAQSLEDGPSEATAEFLAQVAELQGDEKKLSSYQMLELVASYSYFHRDLKASETEAVELLERDPRKREFVDKLLSGKSQTEKAAGLNSFLTKLLDLLKGRLPVSA